MASRGCRGRPQGGVVRGGARSIPFPAPQAFFIARGVRADRGPARRGGARDEPPTIHSRRTVTIARSRGISGRRNASAHHTFPSVSSPPPTSQAFASGFLFGELLARCNMQPDFAKFINKNTPDARINNFTRLQVRRAPTLTIGRAPPPFSRPDRTLSSLASSSSPPRDSGQRPDGSPRSRLSRRDRELRHRPPPLTCPPPPFPALHSPR